jgi:hypothetical protein
LPTEEEEEEEKEEEEDEDEDPQKEDGGGVLFTFPTFQNTYIHPSIYTHTNTVTHILKSQTRLTSAN